jgi:hypothetical protein
MRAIHAGVSAQAWLARSLRVRSRVMVSAANDAFGAQEEDEAFEQCFVGS